MCWSHIHANFSISGHLSFSYANAFQAPTADSFSCSRHYIAANFLGLWSSTYSLSYNTSNFSNGVKSFIIIKNYKKINTYKPSLKFE